MATEKLTYPTPVITDYDNITNRLSSIEDKTDLMETKIIDGVDVPNTSTEVFTFTDPSLLSNKDRPPDPYREILFQKGEISSTVKNPWFYERRWTVPLGLVAAYTMDAGAGSVLRDDSGNFRDATMQTSFAWNASGHNGYCLSGDGTHDYLQLPSALNFGATDSWSFSLWAKEDASKIGGQWFFASDSIGMVKQLIVYTDNKLSFRASDSAFVVLSDALTRTNWNHYVVTYNNGTLKSYINGVYWGTAAKSSIMGFQYLLSTYASGGTRHPLYGLVDNLLIYNRDITSDEASAIYTETSPYTDVYEPPMDNAVWMGKTTTNLVGTTDLSNTAKWHFYPTGAVATSVYDSELGKTVYKWGKGGSTTYSIIADTEFSNIAANHVMSLMVKCNYQITVRGRLGDTAGSYLAAECGAQIVEANTWTLIVGKAVDSTACREEIQYMFTLPGNGVLPSDIEFRACDPYVALESYPMPFVSTTRPAGSLWYNFTWPQQGTVGFWVKPGFGYDKSAKWPFFVSDYKGASYAFRLAYNLTADAFYFAVGTTYISGPTITTITDLQKWWFIGATWDVPNDSLKLYCYSSDYPTGSISSSSADLGTITFLPYLEVGNIPLYTTSDTNCSDSFMAGLFIDDTVWTEPQIKNIFTQRKIVVDSSNFDLGLKETNALAISKTGRLKLNQEFTDIYSLYGDRYAFGATIIETGENAMGAWTKWSNGFMMVTSPYIYITLSSGSASYFGTSSGTTYYANGNFVYPIVFKKVLISLFGQNSGGSVGKISDSTEVATTFQIFSGVSSTTASGVVTVLGYWK